MVIEGQAIPQFGNELIIPPVFAPCIIKDPLTGKVISHNYVITARKVMQQMLPEGFPETMVFGYGGAIMTTNRCACEQVVSSPGPTIMATRGVQVNIKWVNQLEDEHPFPVDPTIEWADPNQIGMIEPDQVPNFPPGLEQAQKPIPIVTHLHGGENNSIFDGEPSTWFTKDEAIVGPNYVTSMTQYPNMQPSTTLWYHDHTLGITRLNVHAGLAGFYIIKDMNNPLDRSNSVLPKGRYDIPLAIQDATFNEDGSFNYPSDGVNPDVHPYWVPEFFGNTIMVNGRVWPNLNVERRLYRFRVLNGSNARFYTMKFSNNMNFTQIGTDGGYLEHPVTLSELTLAPAERADVLVDFSNIPVNTSIILENTANAPFPDGDPVDPLTTGRIMQFTVKGKNRKITPTIPAVLNHIPVLTPNGPTPKRTLVLVEVLSANDMPLQVLLDGQGYMDQATETPLVGSTEEWEFVNLTADTHPIHLHLVQFLAKDRQNMDVDAYYNDWITLNGGNPPPFSSPTKVLEVGNQYLIGNPIAPDDNEKGWKDTLRMNPGQVTRILVRFAPQEADESKVAPGVNLYPFNPCIGPGYVWHCHILEHEDNEMMRPLIIKC